VHSACHRSPAIVTDLSDHAPSDHAPRPVRDEVDATSSDPALAGGSWLTSVLGHELRTPLTSILGFVELLERRGDALSDDDQRMLHVVHRNARRMLLLLNDVLDLARAQAGTLRHQPTEVDLGATVAQVLSDLGATLPQVETDIPFAIARADPNHVEQMLSNLLTNAARHGAPPVHVTVRSPEPGTVEIEVRDRGPGVAPELVDHLWDWFARSQHPGADPRGVGVGLAIVRLLAETNGGSVAYRPGTPTGAVFTLRLPGDAGEAVPRTGPSEVVAAAASPLSIVDPPDDDEARSIAAWATRQVLHASDADEIVGVVLNATHRLGGWTVPSRLADERALPLDLSFGRSEPLLPSADGHSRAFDHLEHYLPPLLEKATRALELLGDHDAGDRPDDPATGLLTAVGLRRVLARLDAPGAIVRLALHAAPNAVHLETSGESATDGPPPDLAVAAFARHLRRRLRITDHAGEVADGEFVLVLPGVSDVQLDLVLDRLARDWATEAPAGVDVVASALPINEDAGDPDGLLAALTDAERCDWHVD
jgi:hypothetical protein